MNTIKLEYHQEIDLKIVKKELEFSKDLLKQPYALESLFVIQVDGKSMQPHINDKALVVADLSQKEFENNGIFLVYKDDKMWIKKALIIDEKEFFVSINPDFSHLVYKKEESRIVAKAILTFTNL
ncbi:MAG: S24 family peptidase [Aliarcobacter sp.]|mgnify:FL=1|jgi:phage repressor protein C with HTH and peptisase S24 domain|nr:S24 family peptidase [Aliarcobacter sp.]